MDLIQFLIDIVIFFKLASNQLRGCHNNSSDLTVCDSKKTGQVVYIHMHTYR